MEAQRHELGHYVRPGAEPLPGVVLVHDVWGVSDHTRDMAGRLAAEGYRVLAGDLYRREGAVQITDPGVFMRALSDPRALADLQAAIDFLHADASSNGRVGIAGFCMGGMYTLMAACRCAGLSAAAPFYGLLSHRRGILHAPQGLDPTLKPHEPLALASGLRCPLLAFFGEQDEFIALDEVRELERELAKSAQPHEVVVYPGAGHAFMNDTRPAAFRPAVAQDAWGRLLRFFATHLGR
jgi:carboxymethylenebutenolidase